MPTSLHLCCSKPGWQDGRRIKCGQPLAVVTQDDEHVHTVCSAGHTRRYTRLYFQRFQEAKPGGQFVPAPAECSNCHTKLNPDIESINRGTVFCGECGRTMVWHAGRQQWEDADVQ